MKCSHRLRKELLTAGFFLFCGASLLNGGQLLDEAKLKQYVDHALTVFDVPGCAVGVVKDAEIVFTGGYGLADVDNGRKVDVATQFKVQSVAKTFTASAVMQLVERGLIRLDDPVAKHVPYFRLADERFKGVTVRMLLNHTSGVPTMYKAEFGFEDPEYDEGALRRHVESLEKKPMLSDPGAEYHYSNNGYAILAALIESVSGMSFEKYMRTRVLDPVGMQRSGFSMSGGRSRSLLPRAPGGASRG